MTEAPSLSDRLRSSLERAAAASTPALHPMLARLSEPVRRLMAIAPSFTPKLLESIGGEQRSSFGELLIELVAHGLVDGSPGAITGRTQAWPAPSGRSELGAPPEPSVALDASFSASTAARVEVLNALTATATEPSERVTLLREATVAAAKVALEARAGLTDVTRRWATLARHARDGKTMAAELDAALGDLDDSASFLAWINAARPLAALIEDAGDTSMRSAIERAGRRLELQIRERVDRRHLAHFFPRTEQIAALDRFVTGPSTAWLLHLLGPGGVGKTMLLRYFANHMAKATGPGRQPFLTARVDFDYLNPDYPRIDPGLLLWSLAQELRVHDQDGKATESFATVDQQFRELRDELLTGKWPGRATDHPDFHEAIQVFGDALRALPHPSAPQPIVLVLDTCEELVKGRWRAGGVDSLSETFRIVGALKYGPQFLRTERPGEDRLPGLRVLFAGRRALAKSGRNWSTDSDLPARDDLDLFELQGFSPDEARLWMGEGGPMRVPADLIESVISATSKIHQPVTITWHPPRAPVAAGLNPYDLKHFAEWAREEPAPEPSVLAHGSNRHYVEQRILRRLDDARLERLLPVVALLKHFDRALLAEAPLAPIIGLGSELDDVMDRLVDHEWIARRSVQAQQASASARFIYEVEEGVRQRLWQYYQDAGLEVAPLAEAAAAALRQRTLSWHPERLEHGDFDAALRAFVEIAPEEGRLYWQEVERRFARLRGFQWLAQLTRTLLDDHEAPESRVGGGLVASMLRLEVLATFASASARAGHEGAASAWTTLLDTAAERHDPRLSALRVRARLGRMVAAPPRDIVELKACAALFAGEMAAWQNTSLNEGALAASFVAAFETLIEQAELCTQQGLDVAPALEACGPGVTQGTLARRLEAFADHPGHRLLGHLNEMERRLRSAAGDVKRISSEDGQPTLPERERAPSPEALRGLAAFAWCLTYRALVYRRTPNPSPEAIDRARDLALRSQPHLWLDWSPPADLATRVALERMRHIDVWQVPPGIVTEPAVVADLRSFDDDRCLSLRLLLAGRVTAQDPLRADERGLDLTRLGPGSCNAHRAVPAATHVTARLSAELDDPNSVAVLGDTIQRRSTLDQATVLHAERHLAACSPRLRRPIVDLPLLAQSPWAAGDDGLLWARFLLTAGNERERRLAVERIPNLYAAKSTVHPIGPWSAPAADVLRRFLLAVSQEIEASQQPNESPKTSILRAGSMERARLVLERALLTLAARERAALLWEVGDLLALFSPNQAIERLEASEQAFAEAGDTMGAFTATARLALLRASRKARADHGGTTRERIVQHFADVKNRRALETALTRCKARFDALPGDGPARRDTWPDVNSLSEIPALVPNWKALAPWLTRLAICQARLASGRFRVSARDRGVIMQLLGDTADAAALCGLSPFQVGEQAPPVVPPTSAFERLVETIPLVRRLTVMALNALARLLAGWSNALAAIRTRNNEPNVLGLWAQDLEDWATAVNTVGGASSADARRAPASHPEAASPTPSSSPKPSAASPWDILSGAIAAVVLLGALALVFLVARPKLSSALGTFGISTTTWWAPARLGLELLAFIVAFYVVAGALGFGIEALRRWLDLRWRFVLSIQAASDGFSTAAGGGASSASSQAERAAAQLPDSLASNTIGTSRPVSQAATLVLERRSFTGAVTPTALGEAVVPFESSRPYAETAAAVPEAWGAEWVRRARRSPHSLVRLAVRVEAPVLARAPWEAILAATAGLEIHTVHATRAVSLAANRATPGRRSGGSVTDAFVGILGASSAGTRLAEDAWRRERSGLSTRRLGDEELLNMVTAAPRVVHVIGRVLRSRGDVVIQVGHRGAGAETFTRAAELAHAYPAAQLMVIQSPPREVVSIRQSTDRINAGFLRELAGQLAERGVPNVITIPGLDANLARDVIAALVDGANSRRPGSQPLLAAVSSMRQQIERFYRESESDGFEMAADVVIYTDPRWRSRVIRGYRLFGGVWPLGRK